MDIATRFPPPRPRRGPYLDREGNAKVMTDDSGGESESNLLNRRKFQRTATTDADPIFRKPSLPASATRAAPATASGALEHRPSLNQRRRSTLRDNAGRVPSGPREFPSSSPGKQRLGGSSSSSSSRVTPSSAGVAADTTTNPTRAFQASNPTESPLQQQQRPFFYHHGHSRTASSNTHLSFANPANDKVEVDSDDSSPTYARARGGSGDDFGGFLPDVNFDDFQTSIKNYGYGSGSDRSLLLLSEFPTAGSAGGGRVLPKEREEEEEEGYSSSGMAKNRRNGSGLAAVSSAGRAQQRQQQILLEEQQQQLGRAQSLRQRLACGRQASAGQQQQQTATAAKESSTVASVAAANTSSLRSRRQSSVPQSQSQSQASSASGAPPPLSGTGTTTTAAKSQPRKSVGPGLLTGMMKGQQHQQTYPPPSESTLKPALARNDSLSSNKASRRTTLGPSGGPSGGAGVGAPSPATELPRELPRVSTLTATTQSRQNKVKSLQPPPRGEPAQQQQQQQQDPANSSGSTPNNKPPGSASKAMGRAHTPSSSGGNNTNTNSSSSSSNKRQSMAASGRASGLGARTISPTDARRLKRMSMMNNPMPPMPMALSVQPMPMEELLDPLAGGGANASSTRMPELPRLAQPSPSFIPRKTSNATPSSDRSSRRASPEAAAAQSRQDSTGGGGGGGVSLGLHSNSSDRSLPLNNHSSLYAMNNGSTSRLPTPKPRATALTYPQLQSSGSSRESMAQQYADQQYGGDEQDFRSEDYEFVPPVPAIPKAYESPKDLESKPPFFSGAGSLKSSSQSQQSVCGFLDPLLVDAGFDGAALPTPWTSSETVRSSFDESSDKRSGEYPRRKRTNTLTNGSTSTTTNTAPPPAPPPIAPPTAPVQRPARGNQQQQADVNWGRKNVNLQPLRLPPLNLMPINTRGVALQNAGSNGPTSLPRPSQETDNRDEYDIMNSFQTPEPKPLGSRTAAKTPSTPMTASKATFSRRHEEQNQSNKAASLRSSSSHYALRSDGSLLGLNTDSEGNLLSKFWDDGSDAENSAGAGVPIPNTHGGKTYNRNAITPFASGSLPKVSGEFVRNMRTGRPSAEYSSQAYPQSQEDEYALAYESFQNAAKALGTRGRAQTGTNPATMSLKSSMLGPETLGGTLDELLPPSYADASKKDSAATAAADKKEPTSGGGVGGLRRKLSLGWRRTSSKAANHAENKSSPQQESTATMEKSEGSRLQKHHRLHHRDGSDMPPPKLPASATWTGEVPSLPSSARPSLDSMTASLQARRKSQLPNSISTTSLVAGAGAADQHDTAGLPSAGVKTRSQHSEQPTPVSATATSTAAQRVSSWGNLANTFRSNAAKQAAKHKLTSSTATISAVVKDKDDLAADEEMQRLSRKRKDVDTAAKESEELKKRAAARSPLSAEHVLHDRSLTGGSVLNVYERGEIVDHEQDGIYFTGRKSARKIIGALTASPAAGSATTAASAADKTGGGGNNFGYDDERGDYNIVLGDHMAYRYEVVDVLGKGSFGQVVRCVDHKDGGIVAIKIIRNKKRFHQQALVEVGILGRLGEWDPDEAYATLSITTSFYFRQHLCIVTPCLSINLYELIRAHNFVGFSLPLIRRFARQLLACLTLLQTKRIIHCDLKPENILLCEARKADVRVIDFGSSCREEEKVYTYIQSRFYRSPEVILGSSYGLGIDMWSLGCILAELWTGYPIFPGENEQEQLACIMEIFGPPDRHLVERCTRKKLFFDSVGKPRVTVSSKGRRRRPSSKTLQQALKTEDEAFIDFITRCLRWDPDRRIKPAEAISHPFITNLPMNQRPGIPDEARRATRARTAAAGPTANGGQGIPSPVKRGAASSGNAFATQQTATPARDRSRILPETPQTAVRSNAGGPITSNLTQGSPVKTSHANNPNRRHSTLTAGSAATGMVGNKRASNGAALAGGGGIGVSVQGAVPAPTTMQ